MKKIELILLFLVLSSSSYTCAQNTEIFIKDEGLKSIPYGTIQIKNKKQIFTVNEKGYTKIQLNVGDSLFFSLVGYENRAEVITKSIPSVTIILKEQIQETATAIISAKATQTSILGYHKHKKRPRYSRFVSVFDEHAVFIENPYNSSYAKAIFIPFRSKPSVFSTLKPVQNAFFRINIYEKDSIWGIPSKEILHNSEVYQTKNFDDLIVIDLSKFSLKLPEKGYFVAIKFIGFEENNTFVGAPTEGVRSYFELTYTQKIKQEYSCTYYYERARMGWMPDAIHREIGENPSNLRIGMEVFVE